MLPQISKTQLNIVRETESEIFAFCPNHQDRNTPNFWITKDNSFGYCFACGFKARIKDLGINMKVTRTPKKREKKDWYQIWQGYYSQIKYSKRCNLAQQLNVSQFTLAAYWYIWMAEYKSHGFPIINEKFNFIGIQKRYDNGRKINVKGSQLGLFSRNEFKHKDTLYILEGISDTLVCDDLGFECLGRLNAKAVTNRCIQFCNNYMPVWKSIQIISDNDKVGIEGSRELQQGLILNEFKDVIVKVPGGSKDLRAFRDKHGKEYTRKWLLA